MNELPEEFSVNMKNLKPLLSLEEMEKEHIKKVLQVAKDLEEASNLLGIDPATLWRKRKRYGLL